MRFAILADVHANWPALEMVLEDLDEQPEVHHIYSLGDQIGYYPYPRECMDALVERGAQCILGNHERYLLELVPTKGMTDVVKQPLEIARAELGEAHLQRLRAMKERRKVRGHFLLVHGSPRHRDEYLVRQHWRANLKLMRREFAEFPLCFFGHTHKPRVISKRRQLGALHESRVIKIEPDEICLVNPGSVGQPRDRCPLASYLIYDSHERTLHFRRVDYPYEETQEAVRRRGLAEKLAVRLAAGR